MVSVARDVERPHIDQPRTSVHAVLDPGDAHARGGRGGILHGTLERPVHLLTAQAGLAPVLDRVRALPDQTERRREWHLGPRVDSNKTRARRVAPLPGGPGG